MAYELDQAPRRRRSAHTPSPRRGARNEARTSCTPSPRQNNRTPAADHRRVIPIRRRRRARLLAPPRRLGLAPPLRLRRVGRRAVPTDVADVARAPGAAPDADLVVIILRGATSSSRLSRTPPVEGFEAAVGRAARPLPARPRRRLVVVALVLFGGCSSGPRLGAAPRRVVVLVLHVLHGVRAQGQVRGKALAAGRAAEALWLLFGLGRCSRRLVRPRRTGRRALLRLLTPTAVAQRLVGLLELPKFVDVAALVRVLLEG